MDSAFLSALLAARPRHFCLGLRLRTLTVGHLFVLSELENALPEHPEALGFPDVITAVLVCSRKTHEEARAVLRSRFGLGIFMRLWGRAMRKRIPAVESKRFFTWYREQFSLPEGAVIPDPNAVPEIKSPLCWRLLAMLMADFHMTREAALGMSVAEAQVLWAVNDDRVNGDRLASERQIAFRRWAAEQDRLHQEEQRLEAAATTEETAGGPGLAAATEKEA